MESAEPTEAAEQTREWLRQRFEEEGPEIDELLSKTRGPDGEVPNVFRVMAWNPKLLSRFNVFAGYFYTKSHLSPRERRLVIIRTAWQRDSMYELANHVVWARDAKEFGEDELASLQMREPEGWDEREQLLIELVDAMTTANSVPGEVMAGAAGSMTEPELVEVFFLSGLYGGLAVFINSMNIALEPKPQEESARLSLSSDSAADS
ncbi:carboxymuconolactone decarboxylase family protein [Microbacterium sp.]|uniref:carboxymuconolactone decarboxylase family protein n=1 Tax=Microbacterium sp. TaxID=51671 RepID=UPI003C28EFAD